MAHSDKTSTRVVVSAITGNFIITIAKIFAWTLNFSPSMLAEAIHSLADTCNQALLYVGIKHSRKGATQNFPMGRGMARYLWNLISAVGIFFVGFGITLYHGVSTLIFHHGDTPAEISWVAIGVLVFAFLLEGYVFCIAFKAVFASKGRKSLKELILTSDDPTSLAVLFEDGIAVLGVVLALLGIWLSHVYQTVTFDAIASIIIALLLGIMAVALAYANGRLLIGTSVSLKDEQEIRDFLETMPEIEKITQLTTSVMGPSVVRLSVEVEFHGGILIDPVQISKDAAKIRSKEEDPIPILVDTADRTIRVLGNTINDLERKLKINFPMITIVEIEVN